MLDRLKTEFAYHVTTKQLGCKAVDGAPRYFSFSRFKVEIVAGGDGKRVRAFLQAINIDVNISGFLFFRIVLVRFYKGGFSPSFNCTAMTVWGVRIVWSSS